MKITIITLALFLLTPLTANESYWQGTVGKSKIYLQLNCDIMKEQKEENACRYSRYFYESDLQDIVMERGDKISKNHYRLQVIHDEKVVEEFTLTHTHGNLNGIWKSKGKSLKVVLKKLKLNDKDDAFENFRTKFLKFKREKVEKLKESKKELVWIEEMHSKTLLFRLGNGFTSESRNKLNPILDKLQKLDASTSLGCSTSYFYGTGIESLASSVGYLSDNLINFSQSISYYCGGAHPDFGTIHYLYDLHSAKKYSLEDILVFQKNTPHNNEDGENDKWYEYIDNIRAKKLRELAFKSKNIPLKAEKVTENNGYDAYNLIHWKFVDWSYEKKGIRIYLDFCSADRCYRGDSFLISFKLLKPYKNKSFPYKFGE